jgi:hypothetical protein
MKYNLAVYCALLLSSSFASAQQQDAAMIVQIGHQYQTVDATFAPGELVSLMVHGVGGNLSSIVIAKQKPLPTELAGISVVLHQAFFLVSVVKVPIYSVQPLPACNWDRAVPPHSAECGIVAGITVQIPFELDWLPSLSTPTPWLEILENGVSKARIFAGAKWAHVHIANTGDDVQVQFPELQTGWYSPVIRHLDRQHFVTWTSPAMPGETLSMWAVGLGQGVGPVQAATGEPAPEGVVIQPGIDFQWGKNLPARALNWPSGGPRPAEGIVSATMIPGQVGIYEILFKVPETIPPEVPPCYNGTYTNLTVSLGFLDSFDGAGICVAQPAATARSQMAKALVHGLYEKLNFKDPDAFPYAASPGHFLDVPESHPQYKWIQRLAELQIASDGASDCGPGSFCPDAQITNGQIAVWVVRAMQVRTDPCATSPDGCDPAVADNFTINSQKPYFADVPASHPYFRWIQKAVELQLIKDGDIRCASGEGACTKDCPPSNFCPAGTTVVAQMNLWVGRAFFAFGRN